MINSVKTKLSELLLNSNTETGANDTNISDAIATLVEGFGASDCVGGKHIINTGLVSLTGSYQATLSVDEGYTLDEGSVAVIMDGVDITSTAYADGIVSIKDLTGDLQIVANARALEQYSINNCLTYCSSNNDIATIYEKQSYSATLTPDDGYELQSVVVTMGGQDVTVDVYADGTITINNITGNIEITAVCGEITSYAVTYSPVGVTLSNQPDTVDRNSSFSTTVTVSLPSWWLLYDRSIVVTMGGVDITSDCCAISADYKTAEIFIESISGDIDIVVSVEYASTLRAITNTKVSSTTNGISGTNSQLYDDCALLGCGTARTSAYTIYGNVYLIPIPIGASQIHLYTMCPELITVEAAFIAGNKYSSNHEFVSTATNDLNLSTTIDICREKWGDWGVVEDGGVNVVFNMFSDPYWSTSTASQLTNSKIRYS